MVVLVAVGVAGRLLSSAVTWYKMESKLIFASFAIVRSAKISISTARESTSFLQKNYAQTLI